jgi:hypothetical protein
MDKMKQNTGIDDALSKLAKDRDKLLGNAPALSPARQVALMKFLVRKFPVEGALREAAKERDRFLNQHSLDIPASASSALHRQLAHANRLTTTPGWLRFFRSPLSAGLAVCAVITAAILCFGPLATLPRRTENLPPRSQTKGVNPDSNMIAHDSPIERADLFSREASIRPFNLKTNEPASLQASFFPNSRISFADGNGAALGLRLDLPVQAFLTDDRLTRTP